MDNKQQDKRQPKSEKYLEVLRGLETQGGVITPEMVVNAAKSVESPLHNVFEWDDTRAANKYRLVQARMLLNSVKVEFMGKRIEGYINAVVTVENVPQRGYISTEVALSNQDIYKQVLRSATMEIDYWKRKYQNITDLAGIINPERLDEVKEKL